MYFIIVAVLPSSRKLDDRSLSLSSRIHSLKHRPPTTLVLLSGSDYYYFVVALNPSLLWLLLYVYVYIDPCLLRYNSITDDCLFLRIHPHSKAPLPNLT